MKKEVVARKLHTMAKVHDFWEMWQRSQNLSATQHKSRAQNKQMTAVGYIADPDEIVQASWSLFQHDGVAAFELSERSPSPPALSAKDLPEGGIQILNIHRIRRMNHQPVDSDGYSTPETIADTDNWLNYNGDLDNPNDSKDNGAADIESDIEADNGIEDPECPEQPEVRTAPNVARLGWPTQKSTRQAEKVLVTVNAIETRRNQVVKKQDDRMRQCFTSFFM